MYIKFLPNDYVLRYRKGRLIEGGQGLSFRYYDKSTAVAVVPVSNMEADFIFEEKTLDFQNVTVQGQLTYRVTDYQKIASQMNFTVKLRSKEYYDTPIKKLAQRIVNIAETMVKSEMGAIRLTQAVKVGGTLAAHMLERLSGVRELAQLGVALTGVSILKISADKETFRALEAETREAILKQSDDALYERRNASIEQERKVKENELNTEISVEEKKKQIRETELGTKKMLLEKENELARIRTISEAERERLQLDAQIELERKRKELAALRLENAKKDADAEAYRIGAVMDAYNRLSPEVLVALATLNMEPEKMIASAFEKLAANSAKIGALNITPDLLESLKGA